MGLCKCPKRQVTNQFCFEHRVNVCENCMIVSHSKCIVQSYLQWLKDSDFNSFCLLCNQSLEAEECVRLICYHVFHWNCLNAQQQNLPQNTAPNGRVCPQPNCNEPIFPPVNLVSPIADNLRSRLQQVNWGRNELGLPLLADERIVQGANFNQYASVEKKNAAFSDGQLTQNRNVVHSHGIGSDQPRSDSPHSVVNMDTYAAPDYHGNSRRPLLAREPPIGRADRDDNKYKKRTPSEIFARWSRQFYAPASKPPWRRKWVLVLTGISVFVFIIYMMSVLGRRATSDNEMLDINNNPMLQHEE